MRHAILIGEAAEILDRPQHQVRRAFDDVWPHSNRSGTTRLVPPDGLCTLAARIEERFGATQPAEATP